MSDNEFVHRFDQFPPEVLKAHDGEKIPLTREPGGPVIGEATLKYNEEAQALEARFRIDDSEIASLFRDGTLPYSIKKES